jgi:hypothetical protein
MVGEGQMDPTCLALNPNSKKSFNCKLFPHTEAIDGQRARLKKLITALYHRHIPAVKLKVNENQANQTTLKQNLDSAGKQSSQSGA